MENEERYKVTFKFKDPERNIGYPIIQARKLSFGYEELLFEDLDLNVDLDSKVAIIGPNGVGKTTLMECLIKKLEPTNGEVFINRKLRIAYFSQHFIENLNYADTPVTHIQKHFPELNNGQCRAKLSQFNLSSEMHNIQISLLSGGQKSRVCLAALAIEEPHILFLDEPTNHLDIESIDALIKALIEFKGGVILITHNQRLIQFVCNELWILRGNKNVDIQYHESAFEEYRQEIIDSIIFSDDEDSF